MHQPHSEIAPSDSASHLPPRAPVSKPKSGPSAVESADASNPDLSLVSTGSRTRGPTRIVDRSDDDDEEARVFREGVQAHSTPKPTTAKTSRAASKSDAVSQQPSPAKAKIKPKPRPNVNPTSARPSASPTKLQLQPVNDNLVEVEQHVDEAAVPVAAKKGPPVVLRAEQPDASPSSKSAAVDPPKRSADPSKALGSTPVSARTARRPAALPESVGEISGAYVPI